MKPLKIKDIREWLIENRNEYLKLKAQEFPPFDNALYWTYQHLYDFIKYYKYEQKCDKALKELKLFVNNNYSQVIKWTKDNEILGSQDLLMFEINYFDWIEDIEDKFIKIHEGLYTERKPFINILCFCEIFQLLYWDNNIHEVILTEQEQLSIKKKVGSIFKQYYLNTDHD